MVCWDWVQTQALVIQSKRSPGGPKAQKPQTVSPCCYAAIPHWSPVSLHLLSLQVLTRRKMLSWALSEGFLIQHLSLPVGAAAPVGWARGVKKAVELHDPLCMEPFLHEQGKPRCVTSIQMECMGRQTLRLDEIKEWVVVFYWLNGCSININLRPDLCFNSAQWLVSQLWIPQSNSHWFYTVLKNNLQNHKVILLSYRSFFLLVFRFNYIPTCSVPLPGLPPASHKHMCTNDVHNILKGPRGAL